jgi:glutamate synthase (NADPH/NADH) small chain
VADPRGFLKYHRQDRPYRDVSDRIRDWQDLYEPMSDADIHAQASRCMDCGVAFCQGPTGCPVENLIPDWNDLITRGRWKDALSALHATNNFPEFTGKLCPAPCESACVLGINDEAVSIRHIEMSIIERGFAEGWVAPFIPKQKTGKKIAIVGSGPAGLAAAQQLAREGHSVTVYERSDSIGGLLRYGVPDFKMEKHLIDRRVQQLTAEGVVFQTHAELGKNIFLADLKRTHDAVALAIGAENARDLRVPGRDLPGVHFAMDYLEAQNRVVSGKATSTPIHAKGKRVVIIGGGDTGSDCLGTAHRQECAEVHQFALANMPAPTRDASTPWPFWPMMLRTSHAHEEGGHRKFNVSTTEFVGDASGVKALRGIQIRKTANGYEPVPGTEFELPVDLVLLAMGFSGARDQPLCAELNLARTSRGTFVVNENYETSVAGVFAAGDSVRGASLIVWAIADGRKMAAAIHRFLA